jgi:mRNA interferase MazF
VKRGDLIIVASPGDYGKPRPALIIQSDSFADLPSVTVLPLTSELHDAPSLRISVEPSQTNGLERPSQVMIDKATTVPRTKIGSRIGGLDEASLSRVSVALSIYLGLG